MKPGTLQIIQDFPLIGDLYSIKMDLNKAKTFQAKRSSVDPSEWHRRVGHPSPERYFKLSEMFSDVPKFDKPTLQPIQCVPCLIGRLKRFSIKKSQRITTHPLELIHLDISGKVEPSLGGSIYTIGFLDDFTAKCDVFMIKS